MPVYTYRKLPESEVAGCDACNGQFEITQRMSEDAIATCPQCGAPVERVITAPNLNGVGFMAKKPSDDRMAKAGFTQYKKQGKGYYEKSFGQGPSSLHS